MLSFVEFSLNGRRHSTTGHSPFYLLYGYEPSYGLDAPSPSFAPSSDDRVAQLRKDRDDIVAALTLAAARMKDYHDRNIRQTAAFKAGDLVWLDARNLQKLQPSWKLSHRRIGPYKVKRQIGDLNYELELPTHMKIHPVFYAGFLSAALQSTIPGRCFPEPPPVIIDNTEEYEVKDVLDSRFYRGHLQYLIKWKGYSHGDNTWEPLDHVLNATDVIAAFHARHPDAPPNTSNRCPRGRRSGGG